MYRNFRSRSPGPEAIIDELIIYPIKGCRGFSVQSATLNSRGLENDRSFMVIKKDTGRFISQRSHPRMCLISTEIRGENLVVTSNIPGRIIPELIIPLNSTGELLVATVWGDECRAYDCGENASQWFTSVLEDKGKDAEVLSLVRMPSPEVFSRAAEQGGTVSFADQYPLLITTRESLAALNKSLVAEGDSPVTMERFRPNVVLRGATGSALAPYAEDMWKRVALSVFACTSPSPDNAAKTEATVEVAVPYPPCARCKVPTNDPQTGILSPTNQPTKVMQVHRSGAALGLTNPKLVKQVFFGIHLASFCGSADSAPSILPRTQVELYCGGPVRALESHASLSLIA
jgi:uncharacterized protein YcbX